MIPGSLRPPSAEKTVRTTRLLFAAFLTTWFLFLVVLYVVKPPERAVSPTLVTALAIAAAADLAIGFTLRKTLLDAAAATPSDDPDSGPALQKWFLGNLTGFACAEAVTLFGLALNLQGAAWKVAGPFFAAGLLTLLWCKPRLLRSA